MNSPIAPSSTLRPPNRSPTQPETGITTASVTRYAVTTPLTDATGTAKYLLSVGSATLTTVASMMFRNMDATNTALTTTFGDRRAFTDYYKAGPAGPVPLSPGRLLAVSRTELPEPPQGDDQADQADEDHEANVGEPLNVGCASTGRPGPGRA